MECAELIAAVRAQFHGTLPDRVAVAVSGGSDSVALLHLLHHCLGDEGVSICAATVDHGLRPEAQTEARQVANVCRELHVDHSILVWHGEKSGGNLQDQARRARYELLTDWAKSSGASVLAVGHTADDQAETFLMRLARGSGVSGLAAMPPRRTVNGVTLIRPLLNVRRHDLRSYLRKRSIQWIDDPSNADERFERVRVRNALESLEPLGLTVPVLAKVASHMKRARDALDWYSFVAAKDIAHIRAGAVSFDARGFRIQPEEISRRLVVRAVSWVGRTEYAPRQTAIDEALTAIRDSTSATLNGCRILTRAGQIWIFRELERVRTLSVPVGETWDGRWRLFGPAAEGMQIGALGQGGLTQCPNWRDSGLPWELLCASPGVWLGDELQAAPAAGMANGWRAELEFGAEEFFATLLSH